jgi:hypothetical protein
VNFYQPSVPGMVRESGSPQQLFEQDVVQRQKAPDGSVIETVSVRRANPDNPSRLGPSQQISETVCKGKCGQ